MNFNLVVFSTPFEKAKGLQFVHFIQDQTIYLFQDVQEGEAFHSRNVRAPFDLAFLDENGLVLGAGTITPPHEGAVAPPGTRIAIETKGGRSAQWGITPGNTFTLQ